MIDFSTLILDRFTSKLNRNRGHNIFPEKFQKIKLRKTILQDQGLLELNVPNQNLTHSISEFKNLKSTKQVEILGE